ncbi:MAG TPA: TlpA disulfide reductase family protein [Blastocatellia bacterium]|nr:TlpA disulfide reductase family protein [Blastocatellia bacterium]
MRKYLLPALAGLLMPCILLSIFGAAATIFTLQKTDAPPVAAPAFEVKDLKGKRVRVSDFKGKVVLLNFWATWCAPCRAEMPELVRMQKEYQSKGLQIVGMTYPEYTRDSVRRMSRQFKLNYPILLGDYDVAELYNVAEVLPTTIVIDREGKIRGRILGIVDAEDFEQQVKPLLE